MGKGGHFYVINVQVCRVLPGKGAPLVGLGRSRADGRRNWGAGKPGEPDFPNKDLNLAFVGIRSSRTPSELIPGLPVRVPG